MRTLWLCLPLAPLIAPVASSAQQLGFGVKAGYASSRTSSPDVRPYGSARQGLAAGVGLSLSVTGSVAVSAELLYAQKGFRDGEARAAVDYLEVPVMVHLTVASGAHRARLRAAVGASGAREVRCRWRTYEPDPFQQGGARVLNYPCIDYRTHFNDLGLLAALALVDSSGLSLEVRYEHGLTNLRAGYADSYRQMNRCVFILVGYSVTLRRRGAAA